MHLRKQFLHNDHIVVFDPFQPDFKFNGQFGKIEKSASDDETYSVRIEGGMQNATDVQVVLLPHQVHSRQSVVTDAQVLKDDTEVAVGNLVNNTKWSAV